MIGDNAEAIYIIWQSLGAAAELTKLLCCRVTLTLPGPHFSSVLRAQDSVRATLATQTLAISHALISRTTYSVINEGL